MNELNNKRNNIINYIFKAGIFLIGFINIRIAISYLGSDLYGIWATIISMVNWINLTDLGIGNGVRNKLTEALANENKEEAQEIVSTAYVTVTLITVVVMIISLNIINILSRKNIVFPEIILPIKITLIGFCINFILGLGRNIAYSTHRSGLVTICQFITSLGTVSGTYILSLATQSNLNLYAINSSLALLISNIILTYIVMKNREEVRPNFKYFSFNKIKSILNLGIKFFILQVYVMIMFSTDNFVINTFIDSNSVTNFSLINRIYDSGNEIFSILLITVWSSVTYALTKGDWDWILKTKNKLILVLIPYSIGCCLVGIIINPLIDIWIGENNINYNLFEISIFIVHSVVLAWNGIYVNILNGMGKLNLQVFLCVISSIINIPLSILMINKFGLGISGVKLATVISILITAIPLPLQVNYELKKMKLARS